MAEQKKFLSRTAILEADDTEYEDVFVEAWGGYVRVRSLTAGERDRWERLVQGLDKEERKKSKGPTITGQHSRAYAVQMATIDENGMRIFPKVSDVFELSKKNSAPINQVFERIIALSKVSEEDLEELEAQYDEDPTELPSIDSPSDSAFGT